MGEGIEIETCRRKEEVTGRKLEVKKRDRVEEKHLPAGKMIQKAGNSERNLKEIGNLDNIWSFWRKKVTNQD